jgi:hypothetical protein
MAFYEDASIKCVDLSEIMNTDGLSPLYELRIKHEKQELLSETIRTIQAENITITETCDGLYIV